MTESKKTYVAPKITTYGDAKKLTGFSLLELGLLDPEKAQGQLGGPRPS